MKLETTVVPGLTNSPLSSAVVSGDLVFASGQTGRIPGGAVHEGFEAQVRQSLENLSTVLSAVGSSLDSVIKTTVFLTNVEDFSAMNEIYASFFNPPYPARSTVVVAALASRALRFEIEAVATRSVSRRSAS